MIFYIGNNCPVNSLTEVEPRLFLDKGWTKHGDAWYKGYSTECVLADNIDSILDGYKPSGKWCVIENEVVYYPVLRGFPLNVRGDEQTNLKLDGFEAIVYPYYPENNPPDYSETLSLEEASTLIGDILIENVQNFYKYNNVEEMTLVFSAGLDTLTCWVIQEQVQPKFTVSVYLPNKNDTTLPLFNGTEREYHTDVMDLLGEAYWAYKHQSYYKEPNWSICGYYAETYTYRDRFALKAILNYTNMTIDELVKETDYYYHFVKRPNAVEYLTSDPMTFESEKAFKDFLWTTIWFDHQMWHLDNNLIFNPFVDVRIPEIALRLSTEDLIRICVNGDIQQNIVKRFRPDLLCLLSDYKNEKDLWKNFKTNFKESMLHPDTKLIYR